jgi:hypothetical protein
VISNVAVCGERRVLGIFLCDWIQHAREIAGFQARSRKIQLFSSKK